MQRREFIKLVGGAAIWPLAAEAQQPGRIPVVGILWHGSAEKEWASPFYHYVHEDFASHGYIADKTVKFVERYASEKQEIYDQLASELIARNPDVLMAPTLPAALALKKATTRIPIIFNAAPDPVGNGLVASITRPGGNATGLAAVQRETYFKRVEIFKQLVPALSSLALIADLEVPAHAALETEYYTAASAANGVRLEAFDARDKRTIDEAFLKLVQARCEGVIIANQGLFYLLRDELSAAALSHRLPTMGPSDAFVPSGILVAYAVVFRERFAEFVTYGVKVLRGERPSELPVLFPTKFQLALNLKTAAALNLTIPPIVLTAADRVIE